MKNIQLDGWRYVYTTRSNGKSSRKALQTMLFLRTGRSDGCRGRSDGPFERVVCTGLYLRPPISTPAHCASAFTKFLHKQKPNGSLISREGRMLIKFCIKRKAKRSYKLNFRTRRLNWYQRCPLYWKLAFSVLVLKISQHRKRSSLKFYTQCLDEC